MNLDSSFWEVKMLLLVWMECYESEFEVEMKRQL